MKRTVWTILALLLPCALLHGEESILSPSKQFYDRSGTPLRTMLSENNTYYEPVSLADISPWLLAAVIAAEDKRFYTHPGVDAAALLRAAWQNAQQGEIVSGASTLTQQLARAVSPRPKTWWGKTKEAWHALQLERTHTKEEILEAYFNWLEFGNLTQGVQAASRFYFNTDADKLSLSQAAFLAGLLKSPTSYNPMTHFDRALKRRNYVLGKMKENGFIDEEMYALALAERLEIKARPRPLHAPHFTQFAAQQTTATQVITTLDLDLQQFAEQTLQNHLARLADNHVTNGAVIVIENATGAVRAYVGSADFTDTKHSGQIDGVRVLRQPGSALKPFVYGLAFEAGTLTPASLLADTDTFFEGGFRPRNYDENFHGWVSARTALACSYNIPAVKAAETVGTERLLNRLRQAGLSSLHKPADFYGLGLALGNGEVRLLELANAYAALARGGVFKPLLVATSPEVKLPGQTVQIFDEETAYLITDILKDNHARADAFGLNSALSVPFEMAAKTGTSKDYKDNFALGYTPRWTIGVWVGNFDASPMQKISGVTGAGPILHDVAIYMQAHFPSPDFAVPPGIIRTPVCTHTGLRAGPTCTHTYETFLDETHLPAVCNGTHQTDVLPLQITAPARGDIFQLDPSAARSSQQLKLAADCPANTCRWTLDSHPLPGTACQTWWALVPGKHTLSVRCANQTDTLTFEVLE